MEDKKKRPELRFVGFTEDWEEKKFEKNFTGIRNNSLSRDKLNYKEGKAKNIHYGDILVKFGEIVDTEKQQLPFVSDDEIAENLKSSRLINGDIILADAAEDETVGKCVEIQNINKEVILSGLHTIAARPLQQFAPKYLGYYMNSSSYHDQLIRLMQGTKVLSISKIAIQDTYVRYPSTEEEQRKISEYLTEIDQLITKHQKKLNRLSTLKKSMLEKMFPKEGQTVPEIRFEGEWEEKTLGELCTITAGGTPSTTISEYWTPKQIPWMSSGEINKKNLWETDNMISEQGIENSSAKWIPAKSVLIALAGQGKTRGTVAINHVPLTTNQSIAAMIPSDNLYFEYLFHNLENRYEELRSLSSGDGSRGGLNKQIISEVVIKCPSFAEQVKIGSFLNRIDLLSSTATKQIGRLKKIKQSLSEKMFV